MTRIAFVCVQNAGRSQMATAFAERERDERGALVARDEGSDDEGSDDEGSDNEGSNRDEANEPEYEQVEIVTGGTDPADHVHEEVVEVMREKDIDLSGRTPREVTHEELQDCDYVITMGCSAEDVCPATWSGENRDWGLDDPDGQNLATVRAIRDEIEERVTALFDKLKHGKCEY